MAVNNGGTGFTLPEYQKTWDLPLAGGYTASSIVILSDSERMSDPTFDWVLAQPVHLTDEDSDAMPFASADGQVREWKISRKDVGRFLALAVHVPEYVGQSVALSGAGMPGA